MRMPGLEDIPTNEVLIVFERPGGKYLRFVARPVPTFEPFKEICPPKMPSWSMNAAGEKKYDTESKEYRAHVDDRNAKFSDWLVIHSLTDASEITWETVDFGDPSTYKNWETEMIAIGVGAGERGRIRSIVEDLNSINENAITKALTSFLAGMQARVAAVSERASHLAEQVSTLSTEPAKDSDSPLQEQEKPGAEPQGQFKSDS